MPAAADAGKPGSGAQGTVPDSGTPGATASLAGELDSGAQGTVPGSGTPGATASLAGAGRFITGTVLPAATMADAGTCQDGASDCGFS